MGVWAFFTKNIKIRKVLIILNKHGKSIVFRLSVKEYNHVCISEVFKCGWISFTYKM